MKVAFVVNDVHTESPLYTTTLLAMAAARRGHALWYVGASDFACTPDNRVHALGRRPRASRDDPERFLAELSDPSALVEDVVLDEIDVVLLRNDPADDAERPWAQWAPITFGRLALRSGTIVLNDPNGLSAARNKQYLQYFPESARPRTLICRDARRIKAFVREQDGPVVLKPLAGSGGQNVFLVRDGDGANVNQIIDAISRDGYVIAQEYLTAAEAGDVRLFMMNGTPLRRDGQYAMFRRTRSGDGDVRSNMSAGGRAIAAEPDEQILRLVEMVRPRLVEDGMFLIGLDIVGDKLTEINVFSPGGFHAMEELYGIDFSVSVIEALERKVQYMQYYHRHFDNAEMATL